MPFCQNSCKRFNYLKKLINNRLPCWLWFEKRTTGWAKYRLLREISPLRENSGYLKFAAGIHILLLDFEDRGIREWGDLSIWDLGLWIAEKKRVGSWEDGKKKGMGFRCQESGVRRQMTDERSQRKYEFERGNKKRRGRRRDLVTGREDATILSGLNIVLIKFHQLVILSMTGYLKWISGFQFDIHWSLTYINFISCGVFI